MEHSSWKLLLDYSIETRCKDFSIRATGGLRAEDQGRGGREYGCKKAGADSFSRQTEKILLDKLL